MALSVFLQRVFLFLSAIYYGLVIAIDLLKLVFTHGLKFVFGRKTYTKPDVLSDPSLGSHGFLHLDQVRIHYVASGPEDKPLMLFLHGFPEFWYSWRHQIKEFQKDYRCVAIDQRGYGESDKPPGFMSYRVPTLLNDVKQVILALGYNNCILVAHDWGGGIAWAFARMFPDMVDKLIVMNAPPGPAFQRVIKKNKEQFKMSWYMYFFQLPYLPEVLMRCCNFGLFDRLFGLDSSVPAHAMSLASSPFHVEVTDEEIQAYKYTYSQPKTTTSTINWYRAALRCKPLTYDMNYTMPVLFIWGMNDKALHRDMVVVTEELNPSICVKRIEGACHFVQMDMPSKVNEAMRDWLIEQN